MNPAQAIPGVATSALTAADFYEEEDYYDEEDGGVPDIQRVTRKNNMLPMWGNQTTMNLNALVLENVKESYYYKNHLIEIDNFQQLIEEINYKVKHLEPWEKGTRKIQGMTGMCGGVRGVGAGGVVSSAYCILYRLFNIKISSIRSVGHIQHLSLFEGNHDYKCANTCRKHLISMINSTVSPYIRGIGFMYIRYTQPPSDLWAWFETYLDDEDEVDPRSGGGESITFGQLVRLMMTKLDWYGTLFPRIPVPIQKEIDEKFAERKREILMAHAAERDRERMTEWVREWDKLGNLPENERQRMADSWKKEPVEKKGRWTRCAHHLRHHHCRKHRKQCPLKAKAKRAEADRLKKAEVSSIMAL